MVCSRLLQCMRKFGVALGKDPRQSPCPGGPSPTLDPASSSLNGGAHRWCSGEPCRSRSDLSPLRGHKSFPGGSTSKGPSCQCRRHKRCSFNPWVGKIPRGGYDNPFQYSCLENSVGRGTWQAMVSKVLRRRTQLKQFSTPAHEES